MWQSLRCTVQLMGKIRNVCSWKVPLSLADTWAHAESSTVTQTPDFGVTSPILHHFSSPVELALCHPHHHIQIPNREKKKILPQTQGQNIDSVHLSTCKKKKVLQQFLQKKSFMKQVWKKVCHIY